MSFYKVENEQLIKAPEKSLKIFIANPTEEQYKFFGYTDKIIEDEKPFIEENQYLEEYYEQIDGVIYKHYQIHTYLEEGLINDNSKNEL